MAYLHNETAYQLPYRAEETVQDKADELHLDEIVVEVGEFDEGYGTIFDIYDTEGRFQFSINTLTNQIFYIEDELDDVLPGYDDDDNYN